MIPRDISNTEIDRIIDIATHDPLMLEYELNSETLIAWLKELKEYRSKEDTK